MIHKTIEAMRQCSAGRRRAAGLILAAATVALIASPARAGAINLVLRPAGQNVNTGQTVEVQLWFVSATSPAQTWIGTDVLIQWDPALKWLGYQDGPALANALTRVSPASPNVPTQIWWSAVTFNPLTAATGNGTLVTTFRFCATSAVNSGRVSALASDPGGGVVFIGDSFNNNVVGTLGSAAVTVHLIPALGDTDTDGDVDLNDFLLFQQCYNGPNRAPAKTNCQTADLDGDQDVDLADFLSFQTCFNGPNRPPQCVCR